MRLVCTIAFPATLILVAMALSADAPQPTQAEKDRKLLQGKWEVVTLSVEGLEIDLQNDKMVLNFQGEKITLKRGDDVLGDAIVTIDTTKKPRTIDFKREKPILGIYELTEKEFKLCVGGGNKARPKGFTSVANDGQALLVMKRAKE